MKIQKVCLYCKKVFTAQKTTTKFCSLACGQRNYKAKMRKSKIDNAIEGARNEMISLVEGKAENDFKKSVPEKLLINVEELSFVIGMSRSTIFNLMKDDAFPRIKARRKLVFDKTDVIAFIKTKYGTI